MSGDRGHPCLVPELTAKSFSEITPLALTLALILFLQYTVDSRSLNLSGQLALAKMVLIVVKLTMSKAFSWSKKAICALFGAGIDEIDDHLDIDDILSIIPAGDKSPLVVSNFFG